MLTVSLLTFCGLNIKTARYIMKSNTERRLGFEIKRTDMNMRHYFDERKGLGEMRPGNEPTHNQRRIMNFLFENKGREIFQKDIEEHFEISPATCSKTLKLIEKNGFIERKSVESDARLKKIVLTEKALELSERIKNDLDEFERLLTKGISEEELDAFFAVLDKVNENIGGKRHD